MKLLADRLIADHLEDDTIAVHVARRLAKSASNHSRDATPSVERFICDIATFELLSEHAERVGRPTIDYHADTKAPIAECWIECGGTGFFVLGETVHVFLNHTIGEFADLLGKDSQIIYIFTFDLGTFDPVLTPLGDHTPVEYLEKFAQVIGNFQLICGLINNPRAATTERVHRHMGETPAERAFRRNRAKRGAPMFSYNVVRLIVPQAPVHRCDVVDSKAFNPKRGHWVIGHWRLLDGKAEPEWVWVDSHKRGDADLGWITKERHLAISDQVSLRRGFAVPNRPGIVGERIKAARRA